MTDGINQPIVVTVTAESALRVHGRSYMSLSTFMDV